nr:MAG TPA: hypothetical protein [Caudoviricetes sp.]
MAVLLFNLNKKRTILLCQFFDTMYQENHYF